MPVEETERVTSRRKQGSADAALFMALFLVVQALLAGLATGARAETVPAGFGVICGSGGLTHIGDGDDERSPAHAPDCCSFGCPMVGGALPPPALATLALVGTVFFVTARVEPASAAEKRAELSPVLSRAPPAV